MKKEKKNYKIIIQKSKKKKEKEAYEIINKYHEENYLKEKY